MRAHAFVFLFLAAAFAPVQARAAGDDAQTAEARARFNEGVSLYDRGKYEAARAAFVQAYALKKHPDVLLNLAWSSLRSGHADEAQQQFEQYLSEMKDENPAKRAEAERGLAEAKAKTGADVTTTTAASVPPPVAAAPPAEKPAP